MKIGKNVDMDKMRSVQAAVNFFAELDEETETGMIEEFIQDQIEDSQRASLHFMSAGLELSIAFGYWANEPTAALFQGDDVLVLIPREVLQIAVDQGWAE